MRITREILVSVTEAVGVWMGSHCFYAHLSDIMELKRMMEKLGQAKTHLELKKMIAEVDYTNSG